MSLRKPDKTRRLAAIMFTDIVGYTALMQDDEATAVKARARHREVFEKEHKLHQGEILQYYGDGTLSVFQSAVEAVKCAIVIQRELQKGDEVPMRIGLHLGDIVFDGTEVYGDGVNLASRIESMGIAGSILLSGRVNKELKNHKEISTISLGHFEFKNIKDPVEIFAVTTEGIKIPAPSQLKGKELAKTIAVLPFVNMSSNAENEYFSDGMTEEIINALAKIKSLKVTSRTSSFYFKNKNISITKIGQELNVSTILEGSIRLSGSKMRITAQLINVVDDFHFWSETFDRPMEDIFAVQDEISLLIADKLREHIGHFEIDETSNRVSSNISAYELYLKSKSNFYKFQKNDILLAIEQIQQAIEKDSSCPFYHASEAIYYGYLGLINAIPSHEAFTISKTAAEKAIQLDATDPEANYSIGMVSYFFEKDLDKAQAFLDLALKYRPNYTNALLGGSVMDVLTSNAERAISRVKKAIEIDPFSPTNIYYHAAALLRLGRYEESLIEVNSLLKLIPHHTNSYCLKGTILTRLKKYDEALEHYRTVPVKPEKAEIYYAGIGIVYATKGDFPKANEYLLKTKLEAQNLHVASEENAVVIINIYLGNFDLAFEEIEKDIKANKYYLNFYKENPAFKLLLDDPRYKIFDKVFKTKGTSNQTDQPIHSKLLPGLSDERLKKKKALLDESDVKVYRNQLLQYMTDKAPYLNANLSLRSLAVSIDLHPNQLSWLLNNSFSKNFNEFINQYRIEAFKSLAKDPANANITVLGLAYDSGFNSKTVFNTYFKKETGLTPNQFLKG